MAKEEYSLPEAAKKLGVSESTIRNLSNRGQLHPIRKPFGRGRGGRRVYYSRAELESLLQQSRSGPVVVEGQPAQVVES